MPHRSPRPLPPMPTLKVSVVALLVALVIPSADAAPADPSVPFEKYTLANGLDVVLSPDTSIPYVWVEVRYEVGSRDEVPGRSGFAHLFEHMMFQGSLHANDDYFQPLQKIGGRVNGNTTQERTVYFEGVPAQYLPLALFLESDRMGWLPDAMTQEKLANQQNVVRNERRQRYETPPYGEAWPKLLESVWPDGHPYHIATIGKHEDLENATLQDTIDFFKKWYLPNNATLVITGDFDPAAAKPLVDTYFGDVAAGPEPTPATAAPVMLTGTKVVKVEKQVPFPRVWMAWITPPTFAAGDADLDLSSAILADGDDAILYKTLVRDRQIAQDVSVSQRSQKLGSLYIIDATASSGHTADELVAAIDEVLANARTSGFTSEDVDLARTGYEVGYFNILRSIQGKADSLGAYNAQTGDPGYMQKDLARYRAATAESVNAAFRTWIPADKRVILEFVPPTSTGGN